jgi:hypothetical protein
LNNSRSATEKRKTKFEECEFKNCIITLENRSNCGQCRYQKCLDLGMSRKNSRFGRHPHLKGVNTINVIGPTTANIDQDKQLVQLFDVFDQSIKNELVACDQNNQESQSNAYQNIQFQIRLFYKACSDFLTVQPEQNAYDYTYNQLISTDKLNSLISFYIMLFDSNDLFSKLYTSDPRFHLINFNYLTSNMTTKLSKIFNYLPFDRHDASQFQLKSACFIYTMIYFISSEQLSSEIDRKLIDLIRKQVLTPQNQIEKSSPSTIAMVKSSTRIFINQSTGSEPNDPYQAVSPINSFSSDNSNMSHWNVSSGSFSWQSTNSAGSFHVNHQKTQEILQWLYSILSILNSNI